MAQAPKIGAVVNSATFGYDVALSAGGLASIFGLNLALGETHVQALPLPKKLGETEVLICKSAKPDDSCSPAGLIYAGPGQVNFLIPETTTGNLFIAVRVSGQLDSDAAASKSNAVGIMPYHPGIFFMGHDCLIDARFKDHDVNCGLTQLKTTALQADRGAVTDQKGALVTSSNRARLGEYYSLWLTGLGKFTNGKPPGDLTMLITNIPVYGYPGDTYETLTPDYVGSSPDFPGLYQINIKLPKNIAEGYPQGYPPMFPCGDYNWEISIDLSEGRPGRQANLIQIPISVKRGDVACR
jgi:uncharacterized protein (TIGR03437 family)